MIIRSEQGSLFTIPNSLFLTPNPSGSQSLMGETPQDRAVSLLTPNCRDVAVLRLYTPNS